MVVQKIETLDTQFARRLKNLQQQYLGGLKLALRAFTFVAALVLVINLSWFAWAKQKYGIVTGIGTIQQGDCSEAKRLSIWLHLLINVLSTLLLMGSNAFMQTVSGPTREEVDRAHQRRRWLRIGTLSFRNLRSIAKRKSLICVVLALSSVPFHLLYNSLIFVSLSAHNYRSAVVTEAFLTGASWNLTEVPHHWTSQYNIDDDSSSQDETRAFHHIQQSLSSYERLDPSKCIRDYSAGFLSSRRHVVAVSSDRDESNSILVYGHAYYRASSTQRTDFWMCSATDAGASIACDPEQYLVNPQAWKIHDHPVIYCLSESVESTCAVQFSFDIMIVVIVFNSLKLLIMCYILFRLDAEKILTSVGDSVASFLICEDQTTHGMCLADSRNIDQSWRQQGYARHYGESPKHWAYAVSRGRWTLFFVMMLVAIASVLHLLIWGLSWLRSQGLDVSLPGLWNLGFGIVNPKALILADNGANIASMAMLANAPQVVLAIIYVTYNGLITSMFTAQDWDSFGFKAKTLMVGSPCGRQRGTWLLGAPFATGFALLALQTLLHWFVSQSIFAVDVSVFGLDGVVEPKSSILNCGYSPIAIVLTLITATIMTLSVIALGLRKFHVQGPPVVSTCSAAISAACHVGGTNQALPFEELRWGVTAWDGDGLGHCAFMTEEACQGFEEEREALDAKFYAGEVAVR